MLKELLGKSLKVLDQISDCRELISTNDWMENQLEKKEEFKDMGIEYEVDEPKGTTVNIININLNFIFK